MHARASVERQLDESNWKVRKKERPHCLLPLLLPRLFLLLLLLAIKIDDRSQQKHKEKKYKYHKLGNNKPLIATTSL